MAAKKKQSEHLRTSTSKCKDLPESVEWLLDFANLDCKPGELNPGSFKGSPTFKRPPSEPGTPIKIHSSTGTAGLTPSLIDQLKDYINIPTTKKKTLKEIIGMAIGSAKQPLKKHGTPLLYQDEKGNDWLEYPDGNPSFVGAENGNPTLQEFRAFFSKTGVIEENKKDIIKIWIFAGASLSYKLKSFFEQDWIHHFIRASFVEAFITNRYNKNQIQLPVLGVKYEDSLCNGLKYSHDNTLSQVTCACILDFWHNHRELHQHLRQCKCCGKFWIKEKTRKKYCAKKCEDRFNQASRQAVRESLKKQRKKLSKDLECTERREIIKWLCKTGDYAPDVAENIYKKEKNRKSSNVASLANFKRTYGKKEGLI